MIQPYNFKNVSGSLKPILLFGNIAKIAYVNNPKSACTFAQNLLFYANHGFGYFDPIAIHTSQFAFWKFGGSATLDNNDAIVALNALAPTVFTIVRDPLRRFVSGFASKLLTTEDHEFNQFRDDITCRGDIDISPTCDKKTSILRFANWIKQYKEEMYLLDPHFKPQIYNVFVDGNPRYKNWGIDSVMKIEDIKAITGFARRHALGMDLDKNLYNKTRVKFEEFYSDELEIIVKELYREDYVAFNY